jgi:hypothetical protein
MVDECKSRKKGRYGAFLMDDWDTAGSRGLH